ncbi:MAG: retropepsin-like domain-containing protein [Phycisphaerales bacterium]|nr:retropepsin-like domain-containing protein [Phycisphaerales bacterium]
MPSYESLRCDPPAPVAEVILRDRASGTSASGILMLIDTGADISLVPRTVVDKLGITVNNDLSYELIGFDGRRTNSPAVEMEMSFLRKIFRGKYIIVDDDWGVLGRDVLAALTILLDGPRQQWLECAAPN